MSMRLAKSAERILGGQEGFALITAVMLLFVAMILGLMAVESSDVEIQLSGAQQRYEESLNTAEGGANVEAAAIGTGDTIDWSDAKRSYTLVDPLLYPQIVSPTNADLPEFDPGGDLPDDGYTVGFDTEPEKWPMDNLVQSTAAANDCYDYHYRVVYQHPMVASPGDSAEQGGGWKDYVFEIKVQKGSQIEMGGTKIGLQSSN